ncbi:hypothetical protein [Clostridium perfringens]|uniref:hypothetical protein n=1 Tax=Clostridium perfringens TaxID=1502 RepID=UPI001FAD72F1|nr:hypothetical protein [Clostridium perfringens]
MKKLKLDVTLATILIVILLVQGIELFKLRNYEIPVLTNSIVEMDLNTVLKNIENKDCTVLQLEYKEGWIGKVLFTEKNKMKTYKEDNLEKLRKMNNINYLLEQKRTDFFWRMNRMFQGLDYDELKTLKKDSKSYEIKRNVSEVIKEKRNKK